MRSAPPSFVPPSRLLLGPGPSPIDPRILQAFTRPTLGHLDPVFLKLMDEVRGMLKQVFRTQNELTFPVSGTGTAGMETCLVNVIEPGDEVVVCVQGYFGARMADIAGRAGGKVTVLNAKWGEGFTPDQVEPALKGKNVKVLCLVQAETSTGYNQPVKEFAELAHKHGALIVVDAVTSTGGIPVEVDGWGIDAIYTGTQKCLGGPPGLAPISFSPRAVEKLDQRKSKVQSWYLDMSLVRKYWGADRAYHHTAPINNIYGLHESLRIVLEEGLEARWKRHQEAHERFARARPRWDWTSRSRRGAASRSSTRSRSPRASTTSPGARSCSKSTASRSGEDWATWPARCGASASWATARGRRSWTSCSSR